MSKPQKIGVLSSGGDAPGMNAAIRAVVRTAVYHDIEVTGIMHGYDGLINGELKNMTKKDVANIIHRGGTILKTARSEHFRTEEGRKQAVRILERNGIEALVVIGGNGSYTGAMKLGEEHDIQVLGIPGTIDNDIYGTDFTIGFDTAVNTAIDAVDKIRDTADSHSRLFLIEVMGRHSGYIALNTGIGSGATKIFLPGRSEDVEAFIALLSESTRRSKLFNLVIVAEGDDQGGAMNLEKKIKSHSEIDVRTTIIGHLQRGGSPTANDRVLASKLGYYAVNELINGTNMMALGLINDKLSLTTFQEAISKSKEPDSEIVRMAEILAM